jgi:hypothetical protein
MSTAAILTFSVAAGCSRHRQDSRRWRAAAVDAGTGPGGAPLAVEFVPDTFDKLYPLFLLRKLAPGPKAALWQRYYGKWVEWTGTLVSFTANGLTFKQLPETVTFDVSLWLEAPQREHLRQRLKIGDRVTYLGRLDSYDDIFRTLYLVHGTIVAGHGPAPGGKRSGDSGEHTGHK